MSQFDSLLDFGDGGTTGESGATEPNGNTAAPSGDDFDPFGPSVTMETKGGSDGNLLVDFTADSEVSSSQQQQQNGLIDDSDPFGISAEVTTSSSTDKPPSNNDLLFDMSAGANPLYEYSTKTETQEEDDGLVTTTVTTTTSSSSATASANPLYDFLENGGEGQAQEESLLEMPEPAVASSQNGVPTETAAEPEDVEESLMQEPETELIIREDEPAVEMEPAREPSPEPAQAEPEEEPEAEPDRVEEEPEMEPEPELEPEPAPEPETLRIVESGDEEPAAKEEHKEIEVDEPDMVESAGLKEEAMMRDFEERDMMRSPSCSSEEAMATKGQEPGAALASGDMVRSASGEQYGGGGSLVTGAEFVNSSYRTEPEENGTDEIPRDPNIVRETREKEEVHFTELSSVKNRFESGQSEEAPRHAVDVREEYTRVEGGEYENTPVQRTDVVREADRNIGAELPEIGTAKNLRAKFTSYQSEQPARRSYREPTPPDSAAGGEYVSEPRGYVEKYEGKAEAGVFENVPVTPSDVVRSGEAVQEELPEHGYAKNVAARFKQLEKQPQSHSTPGKRQLTPDRTGRSEYVSEPRATMEAYEGKAESGVFENVPSSEEGVVRSGEQAPDVLPERGVAKNLTAKWRQMESGASGPPPSPGGKRAITPDRSGRSEYVSEPRAHFEHYEGKAEAGVFESTPQGRADVVRSEDHLEEPLPEHGLAKNLAARFRELETQAKSPPSSAGRTKEITPPRDAGVYESQPQAAGEVARGDQQVEEVLPQKGTARSMASRFLQIAEENKSPPSPTRGVKEFTPPRNHAGQVEADAGVRESQPQHRPDVLRESDPVNYEQELPERGAAKNVLSKFRQMESESAKQQSSSGGRVKEFTPPREEPRVLAARSPKTPSGGLANAGHVHPSELPGQYQPQVEESVFESEPQHRPDVVREADTDWEEGLPAKNTTRSMVDRFRTIQAETSKEQAEPVSRKDEDEVDHDRDSKTRKSFVAVQTEKCGTCQKTVYAMERLEMNKCVYHKNCFRCSHCKAMLTPKTFAVNNGTIFCTAHYKQLFARKGNYDEGFGREQHKQRWRSEANGTEEGADS